MFVLEPESSERVGYGYIDGYAFANDSRDYLCSGVADAARMALAAAGIKPSEIDAVNAWGPGHQLIDAGEAMAMKAVFGNALPEVAVCSIKGAVGSALGAAPAIQLGASALAQRHGIIPPTVNWTFPDPSCPLRISKQPQMIDHTVTLINAHGVGNVNSCMVLRRC